MLAELKRAHAALLSGIDELEKLALDDVPDRATLANVRWKLSKASGERRRLVDTACDLLMASADAIDRNRVMLLRENNAETVAASSRHVGHWTMDAVIADWDSYREASTVLRKAMRGRILQEQRALYPLLERTTG